LYANLAGIFRKKNTPRTPTQKPNKTNTINIGRVGAN
jgi:hypothetical protein